MFKITINNADIDNYESNNIVLNRTLFSYGSVQNRNVGFSNQIFLPATKTNEEIFNLNSSNIYSQEFEAKIYWKNDLIVDGLCKVTNIQRNRYNAAVGRFKIQIYDKIKRFYKDIEDDLFKLDLSADDFVFNETSYDSLKSSNTSFMFWPLVDNRGLKDAQIVDNTLIPTNTSRPDRAYTRPSYVVYRLIEEIASNQGYSVDWSNISSIYYDKLLLSACAEDFRFTDFELQLGSTAYTSGGFVDLSGASVPIVPVNFFDTSSSTTEIELKRAPSRVAIKLSINVNTAVFNINSKEGLNTRVTETYFISDGTLNIVSDEYEINDLGTFLSFSFDRDLTINSLEVYGLTSEGRYYSASDVVTWGDGSTLNGWRKTISLVDVPLLEDYEIKASYNLPSWTQKQLLFEFMDLFNLEADIKAGQLVFTRRNSFNRDGSYTVEKLANEPLVEPFTEINAINRFEYSNDIENETDEEIPEMTEKYASYEKTVESELLNNKGTTVSLSSSASVDLIKKDPLGSNAYYVMVNVPTLNMTSPLNDDIEDRAILKPRFYLYTSDELPTSQASYKGYFIKSLLASDSYFENLGWETLFENYYYQNYGLSGDLIKVPYQLWLTYKGYLSIIKNKVIYDPKLGRYFTVIAISKFNPSRITDVLAVQLDLVDPYATPPTALVDDGDTLIDDGVVLFD
jgi:hypothetical protein